MARIKVRYLTKKPGRGGTTRYFWTPGPALRKAGWMNQRLAEDTGLEADAIREAEELNARVDAWRTGDDPALKKNQPAPHGTLQEVIDLYLRSEEFTERRPATQRRYLQNIKVIEQWTNHETAGPAPLAAITAKKIKTFYQELRADKPSKAQQAVGMLSILFSFAMSESLTKDNPAMAVTTKKVRRAKNENDIWSPKAIEVFVRTADAMNLHSIGTAVMLNEWIGQRQGDVLTMSRNVYQGGALQFIQSKTGAEVYLPIDMVPGLAGRLEEERQRQKKADVTATSLIVCELTGKAWNVHTFRAQFNKIRERAAKDLDECTAVIFQRLRHTAITRLAEAGVDPSGISSITGHSLQTINQILEHYLVRTKKMATQAFAIRLAAEGKDIEQ